MEERDFRCANGDDGPVRHASEYFFGGSGDNRLKGFLYELRDG